MAEACAIASSAGTRHDDCHYAVPGRIGDATSARLDSPPHDCTPHHTELEEYSPLGSIKYRTVLGMIKDDEAHGALTRGKSTTIAEPTSGNTKMASTGIAGRLIESICNTRRGKRQDQAHNPQPRRQDV